MLRRQLNPSLNNRSRRSVLTRRLRSVLFLTAGLVVHQATALADEAIRAPSGGRMATDPQAYSASVTNKTAKDKWAYSASVSAFLQAEGENYLSPTATADRGKLHLEARYNSEALDTGSLWAGLNLTGGGKLAWAITPIFGAVFGDLNGVAPGYEVSLTWGKYEFYSSGEYVFDLDNGLGSYFYNWSEWTYQQSDWFTFGLAVQRTRIHETAKEVQPGIFARFTMQNTQFAAYVFDSGESNPLWTLVVDVSW